MSNKEKQYETLNYIREQDRHGKLVYIRELANKFNIKYESAASRLYTLEKRQLIRRIKPNDYEITPSASKFIELFESSQLTAGKVKITKKGEKQRQQTITSKNNKIIITIEIC